MRHRRPRGLPSRSTPVAGRFTPAGIPRLRLGQDCHGERQLSCLWAEGKLINLTHRFAACGAAGQCGIGHTRSATHDKPEERNAHPHLDGPGRVAVVQNGIIENYRTLREELQAEEVVFRSDTDTEVIPHLLSRELARVVDCLGLRVCK